MADIPFNVIFSEFVYSSPQKVQKSVSYKSITAKNNIKNSRCRSQERFSFNHQVFNHPKIVKASHNIPLGFRCVQEFKHIHDNSRTVTIKRRIVSQNILLDSFPTHS